MVLQKEELAKAKENILKVLKEQTSDTREQRRILERLRYDLLKQEK